MLLGLVAVLVAGALVARLGGDEALPTGADRLGTAPTRAEVAAFDPLPYRRDQDESFLERGRDGFAHVLFAKSPGGVDASAARTAGWRDEIEAAADRAGVRPDTLEALVFLESAGRPDVVAGGDPEGAAGLGQILPATATSLLGMRVDLATSRALTRRFTRAQKQAVTGRTRRGRRAAQRRARRLAAERRRVDERFDPRPALAGAARYLAVAEERFGREDLATASYHMGMGNLEAVIARYVSPRRPAATPAATVARYGLTYPRLFFDSSPLRNPRTYRLLRGLGDDSRSYVFRLEAAREIMRLWREEPDELRRLVALHGAKASAEEVLRPAAEYPPFEDADALRDAYDDEDLVPVPDDPRRLGLRVDRGMGSGAPALGEEAALYRGLRPEALAVLLHAAKEVRSTGGGTVRITSGVRDLPYQRTLVLSNPEATAAFSLHTTGYAFDLARPRAGSRREAALVAVLDRLRALDVVAWVYEPTALHVTVGPEGARYLGLLDALVPAGG